MDSEASLFPGRIYRAKAVAKHSSLIGPKWQRQLHPTGICFLVTQKIGD
jgi:hypothetical protein